MKWAIGAVAAAVAVLTVATAVVGHRLFEEQVVRDPYQAGLRWDEDRKRAAGPDCDLARGPCERTGPGDLVVRLDVAPRPPRAMVDLEFTVQARLGGRPLRAAGGEIALSMPGMYMGDNRVPLAPAGPGSFKGRGVVVRCPSGGRVWTAEVALRPQEPAAGPWRATFTFELAE
ncbi:MAG TPA: hypothetical protein VH880_11540 [Anaeromyxobacteraceae bacterium]